MKTIKANIKVPKDILEIQEIFTSHYKKLFIVGGAVRDFLLGKEPSDFDLVTDAVPNEVIDMLKDYNTDLQGAHFGVVRVFTTDEPDGHEIASFRNDISHGRDTKGDDQKVEIGHHITIKDDVKRRDLTINALFFDIEKQEIVDLVGGIDDLEDKVIRTVGKAADRFNEDRLRILRACRLSATLGFRMHIDTLKAIMSDGKLFGISEKDDVSKERIIAEFVKMEEKSVGDPTKLVFFFEMLETYDILSQLFQNADLNPFIKETESLVLILAQILINNKLGKGFTKMLKDAKLPTKMINQIIGLIEFSGTPTSDNIVQLNKTVKSKHIGDLLSDWFFIRGFDTEVLRPFFLFKLTVSGNDVKADGFKGKDIADEICRREKINFENFIKTL